MRESKILILDEAAASVDVETDQLIQKTINEQFHNQTVLTIAHRIQSIIESSNRIIVFDEGKIVEFDTPQTLINRTNSIFYLLALDAGIISAK